MPCSYSTAFPVSSAVSWSAGRCLAGCPQALSEGSRYRWTTFPKGCGRPWQARLGRTWSTWRSIRGSAARVARDIKALVLDLPAFVGHHFDGFTALQEQFRMLRRTGATVREALEQARPAATNAAGIGKAIIHGMADELTKEFVTKTRVRLVAGLGEGARDGLRARGVLESTWDEKVVRSPLGSLPALDTLVQAMAAHLRRSMMPGANRRLLDSDLADMFHALYLPYVDAFRCDANTAQVLAPIAAGRGVALLSRLEEVPGWIEARRASRERGGAFIADHLTTFGAMTGERQPLHIGSESSTRPKGYPSQVLMVALTVSAAEWEEEFARRLTAVACVPIPCASPVEWFYPVSCGRARGKGRSGPGRTH